MLMMLRLELADKPKGPSHDLRAEVKGRKGPGRDQRVNQRAVMPQAPAEKAKVGRKVPVGAERAKRVKARARKVRTRSRMRGVEKQPLDGHDPWPRGPRGQGRLRPSSHNLRV